VAINNPEGHITTDDPESIVPVLGSSPKIDQDDIGKWKREDRTILANICRCVERDAMVNNHSAKTSLEAWDHLKSLYKTTDIMMLIHTRQKFFSRRMLDGERVEEQLQGMQEMYDRLLGIDTKYATTFD
jgi:hypothetical protein